jgi:hypothetical protein
MRPNPMTLLHDGVPITLLLDLADPDRLPSRSICRRERGKADWLQLPAVRSQTAAAAGVGAVR